jgi:hypothetical protein
VTALADPLRIAADVAAVFERLGIRYTTGGSIASSFAGEPRATIDVDFVAELHEATIAPLLAELERDFYVSADGLRRAVRDRASVNLIHQRTSVKIDVFVAGGTPLDSQQLDRRRLIDVGGGIQLYVHPPEDILLQKLLWFRKGGEVSDRQWRDIAGIVRVQGERLDREYLQQNAPQIGVTDLLARALG